MQRSLQMANTAPTKKRLAIFASYDAKGKIRDSVLYYLRGLRDVCQTIIFIADNDAEVNEQTKLSEFADFSFFARHGEYDFGSYKRGFQFADENGLLVGVHELILCNDSCLGPIKPLTEIFSTLEDNHTIDFWGITENYEISPHLQSYFLVFRRNVFTHSCFQSFLRSVTKLPYWDIVLTYEIPFTAYLSQYGFRHTSFIPAWDKHDPSRRMYSLLKKGSPFIKKKVLTEVKYTREPILSFLSELKRVNEELYGRIRREFPLTRLFLKYLRYMFCHAKRCPDKTVWHVCGIPYTSYKTKSDM